MQGDGGHTESYAYLTRNILDANNNFKVLFAIKIFPIFTFLLIFSFMTDGEAPVFDVCPSSFNQSTNLGRSDAYVIFTRPNATDNVGVVSVDGNIEPGRNMFLGTSILTYVATDAAGNTAECNFNITVIGE